MPTATGVNLSKIWGNQNIGGRIKGGNKWRKHRRFSFIGSTQPGCPPSLRLCPLLSQKQLNGTLQRYSRVTAPYKLPFLLLFKVLLLLILFFSIMHRIADYTVYMYNNFASLPIVYYLGICITVQQYTVQLHSILIHLQGLEVHKEHRWSRRFELSSNSPTR